MRIYFSTKSLLLPHCVSNSASHEITPCRQLPRYLFIRRTLLPRAIIGRELENIFARHSRVLPLLRRVFPQIIDSPRHLPMHLNLPVFLHAFCLLAINIRLLLADSSSANIFEQQGTHQSLRTKRLKIEDFESYFVTFAVPKRVRF